MNGMRPTVDIADRVNTLFDVHRRPNGREYSNAEVARFVGVTGAHIGQIRSGRTTNPRLSDILGIARFFGVDITYLTGSNEAREADDGRLVALACNRMGDLLPDEQQLILDAIDMFRARRAQSPGPAGNQSGPLGGTGSSVA